MTKLKSLVAKTYAERGEYVSSMENGVIGKQIKKYVGVLKTTYSAKIYDPLKKKIIWLGTFKTPEEASRVYLSKKLELDKIRVSQMLPPVIPKESKNVPDCVNDGENQVSKVDQKVKNYKYKYPGVWKRKSGRYSCRIKDPVTKRKVYSGTYDTAEEAFKVCIKKKVNVQGPQSNKELMEGLVVQDSCSGEMNLSNGLKIMDNNGYLLGEWSWIDDLSIYK